MALIRKSKSFFTAKVAKVNDFPAPQSISVLAVVKTQDGLPITDMPVNINLSEDHPLAQGLYDGQISELAFQANGFSAEQGKAVVVRGTPERPIFALTGLDKQTLTQLLSASSTDGTVATDEQELKRKQGMATRAKAWMDNILDRVLG